MARFLGAVQGNRGEATRLGTPAAGIRAQAQGWNVGVKVYGEPMRDGNRADIGDSFTVIVTGGSHGAERERVALRVSREHGGEIIVEWDPYGEHDRADAEAARA